MQSQISRTLVAALALSLAAACSDTDDTNPIPSPSPSPTTAPTKNIVATAQGDAQFSTLVTAIQAAMLAEALSQPGPFTVFAPTNAAFEKLPAGALQNLLKPENKAELQRVLQYHVVQGRLLAADVVAAPSANTLAGATITFSKNGDVVRVNEATVTATNILTTNGVIHVIDGVLLPPALEKDIVELAQATPTLSTLVSAVVAADLVDTLKGTGPFTVFAPTNAAFEALPAGLLTELLLPANKMRLANILTYHVVPGEQNAAAVVAASGFTAVNGDRLPIVLGPNNSVRIGGALITMTDIQAKNGVVHVIDAVMLPNAEKTIVQIAQETPALSTLVQAVVAADLAGALSGNGPFTVFAPTNDAFAALPAGALARLLTPAGKDDLTTILTYHVTPGALDAAAVTATSTLATLAQIPLSVTVNGNEVRVGGAKVAITNIRAKNGIVHVIESVILPPSIVDIAAANPDFSTLVAAVTAAELAETLDTQGPFTVFAPRNAAFAKLPAGTVDNLLLPANRAQLVAILQLHVVSGRLLAADVLGRQSLTTISNANIAVTNTNGQPRVGGAAIIATDIRAGNGVIHVLDDVILPTP
jgi:transforming growth factor-beta-induced protein